MRARKVDDNQKQIVTALRKIPGLTVLHLHTVGQGCPDLAIGYKGLTFLFELKDGAKPPSARKLTPDEQEWHDRWTGHVAVVETTEQILNLIGIRNLQTEN